MKPGQEALQSCINMQLYAGQKRAEATNTSDNEIMLMDSCEALDFY